MEVFSDAQQTDDATADATQAQAQAPPPPVKVQVPVTDAAALRQRAVSDIRTRVVKVAGTWLSTAECVQVALACATREPENVLGVLFNPRVSAAATANATMLAITHDEWQSLYGVSARQTRPGTVDAVLAEPVVAATVDRLCNALRCTLLEPQQSRGWQSSWRRLVCFASLHTASEAELFIDASLGGLVRSDARRLEDLFDACSACDELVVSQALVALAESAT
jgi:hypothetical protein